MKTNTGIDTVKTIHGDLIQNFYPAQPSEELKQLLREVRELVHLLKEKEVGKNEKVN